MNAPFLSFDFKLNGFLQTQLYLRKNGERISDSQFQDGRHVICTCIPISPSRSSRCPKFILIYMYTIMPMSALMLRPKHTHQPKAQRFLKELDFKLFLFNFKHLIQIVKY